jgi:transposase InsO family protein
MEQQQVMSPRTILPFLGDEDEWDNWSFSYEAYSAGVGQWEHLTGAVPRPAEGAEAQAAWDQVQRSIYFHLVSCMRKDAVGIMRNTVRGDGAGAWRILTERFNNRAPARISILQGKFYDPSSNMKRNETISEYLDRLETMRRKLADLGAEVPLPQALGRITRGLPPLFDPLMAVLMLRPVPEGNPEVVYRRTLDEIRLFGVERQLRTDVNQEVALRADFRGDCFICNKPGHKASDCHLGQQRHDSRSGKAGHHNKGHNTKSGVKCNNCAKPGHKAADCWAPGGGKEGQGPKRHHQAKTAKADGHQAIAFTAERLISLSPLIKEDVLDACGVEIDDDVEQPLADEAPVLTTELHAEQAFVAGPKTDSLWLIDSGASSHMTPFVSDLVDIDDSVRCEVRVANDTVEHAAGQGEVHVSVKTADGGSIMMTFKALLVPSLSQRLFSVRSMIQRGHSITFNAQGSSKIVCRDGTEIVLDQDRSIFYLPTCDLEFAARVTVNFDILHQRLGHVNFRTLQEGISRGSFVGVGPLSTAKAKFCEVCVRGKDTRKPQSTQPAERATSKGEKIHTDLFGPVSKASIGGKFYAIVFVDDFSRHRWIYFIKTKDQAVAKLTEFMDEMRTDAVTVRRIHSDGGGEFISAEFKSVCAAAGVKQTFTAPHSPAQNGVAERSLRTIVEMARCMLKGAGLSLSYWSAAMDTAVYIINRMPTRVNDWKSPIELWTGGVPDLSTLRVFGCDAFVHIETGRKKFDDKAEKGVFVGYDKVSKCYLVYVPSKHAIRRSLNVTFAEQGDKSKDMSDDMEEYDSLNGAEAVVLPAVAQPQIPAAPLQPALPAPHVLHPVAPAAALNHGGAADAAVGEQPLPPDDALHQHDDVSDTDDSDGDTVPIDSDEFDEGADPAPRRSQRNRRPPQRWIAECNQVTALAACVSGDPLTLDEALSGPDAEKWRAAMKSEMDALVANGTWDLASLPAGRKAVGSKWVFKTKRNAKGDIIRHKARLVAKGFTQVQGVDFTDTFAPVARFTSFRLLLSIAAQEDWLLEQTDVSTAFLNAELKEQIYMDQAELFEVRGEGGEKLVCLLKRGIYGLKQSPRYWNNLINTWLLEFGFVRSATDPCVYVLHRADSILVLVLYVDDMLYGSNDKLLMHAFKTAIAKRFRISHEGPVAWLLGMDISRSAAGISVRQSKYIRDMLARFNMSDCKPMASPAVKGLTLTEGEPGKAEQAAMKAKPFASLVGSLLYAMVCTRPDIAAAVLAVSRHMSNPSEQHWTAAKRILRYLHGTQSMGLTFRRDGGGLLGFSDADWGGDTVTRKSTTGFLFLFGGAAISWSSKLQATVALSSVEAEYMALSTTVQEALYVRNLLADIGFPQAQSTPVLCDNQGSLALAKDPVFRPRTKHIDIRYHFIRERIEQGVIKVEYCPTESMVADALTKPLQGAQFEFCRTNMLGKPLP